MDPLTLAISTLLGKYAIDKGATLLKEAGQAQDEAVNSSQQSAISSQRHRRGEAFPNGEH